jgi:hypothetical protein
MRWRLAKKLHKLDGKTTGTERGRLRRWSAWHRISARHWDRLFAEFAAALSTAAALTERAHLTTDDLEAALAVLTWVPKPVEFEWFVSEQTIGRGIWVEAYIDAQIRGLEHDGWQVESWLHPTPTHRRRLVVHACRRIAERGS